MNLKKRFVFFISLAVFVLISTIAIISRIIFLDKFEQIERTSVRKDIDRITKIIEKEIYNLSVTTRDYASWDDTYQFINDGNNSFIKRNIIEQTFIELNLNLMFFIKSDGKIVLGRSLDLQSKQFAGIDSSIYKYTEKNSPFMSPDLSNGERGIVKLKSGSMLLASRAILTSESKGPSRGVVFFGKYLDPELVKKFSNLSLVDINLLEPDNNNMNGNSILRQIEKSNYYWDESNSDSISIYTAIKDIYGKPINIVKITEDKTISSEGFSSIAFFVAYVILLSFIFLFATYYFIRKMFVARAVSIEMENLYKKLFDTSPEAVILATNKGVIEKLNLQGQSLLQNDKDQLNLKIIDYISEDNKEAFLRSINSVLQTSVSNTIELTLDLKSMLKIIEFNIAIIKASRNEDDRLLMILRDITEKRNFENKLKEDQVFINAVVNTSPSFVYIFDFTAHKNVFCNRSIYEYLGYDREKYKDECIGINRELIHADDKIVYEEMIKRLLTSFHTDYVEYEIRLFSNDGEWIWFFIQETVFKRNERGDVTQI